MGGSEQKFINEAFEQNWIAPVGPNIDGFESDLQRYTGCKHAVALSSGTAAIHLALIMVGVSAGDYVICQSLTFAASANPIRYLGATPIFVDSEYSTWNLSPPLLEKAIEQAIAGKLTQQGSGESLPPKLPKAIIAVNLYGMPADLGAICSLADKYGIPVIEDAAESLGSKYKGKSTGSFGTAGVLSFNGNKIITTSSGGALVSNDKSLTERARFLSTQARDPAPHYQHSEIGYNYRMSNVLAGIGRGQMICLEERVRKKREINSWYRDVLYPAKGIIFQTEPNKNFYSNYWLTSITIDPEQSGVTREEVRAKLLENDIESRPVWKPLHQQPIFSNFPLVTDGTSDEIFKSGLCLPSGSNLIDEDLGRIEYSIKSIFGI